MTWGEIRTHYSAAYGGQLPMPKLEAELVDLWKRYPELFTVEANRLEVAYKKRQVFSPWPNLKTNILERLNTTYDQIEVDYTPTIPDDQPARARFNRLNAERATTEPVDTETPVVLSPTAPTWLREGAQRLGIPLAPTSDDIDWSAK